MKDLKKAIAEYQKSFPESDVQALQIDPENCSWEDVLKQMDNAKVRYDNKDNGIGFLRRWWRKAGENKEAFDPWLEMMPDQYGLSFVRGGIVIILSVSLLEIFLNLAPRKYILIWNYFKSLHRGPLRTERKC